MNLLILVPIIAGWLEGWIVNYLSDVLPGARRLTRPTCIHCNEILPLPAYLAFLSCPNCHRRRPARVWVVQVGLIIANLYIWSRSPFGIFHFDPSNHVAYWAGTILLAYFAMVFVIDFEHRLILHSTSIFGAAFGIVLGLWMNGLVLTFIGGLAGFLIMLGFYYLGVLFSRVRARRMQAAGQDSDDEEALGFGDVILGGILGFMLGPFIWISLLMGILLGGLVGVILILYLMVAQRYKKEALMVFMPYGPFFIVSASLLLYVPAWIAPIVPK